jgi:hypothetical protein
MLLAASLAASTLRAAPPAQAPAPRYALAMQHELEELGLDPSCELLPKARYECVYEGRQLANGSRPRMHALYLSANETVYVYLERYLELPPAGAKTSSVLQRLMELNWELLVGKLEWNPRDGEVRLSAVLNTDSNFDRRAFRSIVHSIETVAARYERELRALAGN